MSQQVWFVTGASKGLGLALVNKLLSQGHKVAATSRSLQGLIKAVSPASESFLPLEVNLSNEKSISDAVAKTKATWGRIDVLVNNAGYGQFGAVEEVSDKEARENFEVNVFGALNVIRGVLPLMREKKSGHIFNISSIGGFSGAFPGCGVYCATKFALSGLTEGLHSDLSPLGIKVTLVYPGYFKTDFLTKESMTVPGNKISDYTAAHSVIDAHVNDINHNQPGDPAKASQVMIDAAQMPSAPMHLFLGPDSFELAQQKMVLMQSELEKWKDLSRSTNA